MEILLAGAVVLGILVIAHETGHLVAGLRLGVTVLKFSIGFGPKVIGFTWRNIEWVISAIPLGGFVKFAGEDIHDHEHGPEEVVHGPGDFSVQPWWVKVIVAVSGPGMNFVLAFFLLGLAAMIGLQISDPELIIGTVEERSEAEVHGFEPGDRITQIGNRKLSGWFDLMEALNTYAEGEREIVVPLVISRNLVDDTLQVDTKGDFLNGIGLALPPVVGEVTIGFPAFDAGLQEGDSIVNVAGIPVRSYEELRAAIKERANQEIDVQFMRSDNLMSTAITPIDGTSVGQDPGGLIGIVGPQGNQRTVRFGLMAAVTHAAEMTVNLTGEIYGGLFKMVRNPRGIRRQLGGPIAIAQLSAKQARKGLDSILNFIAVISVMLAVVNLLPIPILDGGMVLFSIVEGIRREPLSLKSQLILQRIGFAFLVSLMAFSLVNDIGRVWKRHKAIDKPVETSTVIDDSTNSG